MKKHTQYLRAEHEAAKQQTTGADSAAETRDLILIDNRAADGAAEGKCHRWLNAAHLVGEPNPPLIQAWASTPEEATRIAAELVRRWNSHNDLLAALEDLLRVYGLPYDPDRARAARAAINKAKTL